MKDHEIKIQELDQLAEDCNIRTYEKMGAPKVVIEDMRGTFRQGLIHGRLFPKPNGPSAYDRYTGLMQVTVSVLMIVSNYKNSPTFMWIWFCLMCGQIFVFFILPIYFRRSLRSFYENLKLKDGEDN